MNPSADKLDVDYMVISGGGLGRRDIGSKIRATVEIGSGISGEISVYLRRVSHSGEATTITVSTTPDGRVTADFDLTPGTSVLLYDAEEI